MSWSICESAIDDAKINAIGSTINNFSQTDTSGNTLKFPPSVENMF